MNKLTWNDLLSLLLQQKENNTFKPDNYVMVYNTETGDEHYCNLLNTVHGSGIQERLVIGYNFGID